MQTTTQDTDFEHLIEPATTTLATPTYIGPHKPQEKHFNPIQNARAKPEGGIWTSPSLDNEDYLTPYTRFENRALVQSTHEIWYLQPKENAKIIHIDTKEKLEQLPTHQQKYNGRKFPDYEQIFDNTDAQGLNITKNVAHIKSFSKDHHLGSWDFTSTIWRDLDWIKNKTYDGQVQEH